jgi:galactokinase
MTARDIEAALLTRCTAIARETAQTALDEREANVFQAAAMVVRSQFPRESTSLMRVSEAYFATHPNERLASGDVVRRGWITSLPRLRDMLTHQLHGH